MGRNYRLKALWLKHPALTGMCEDIIRVTCRVLGDSGPWCSRSDTQGPTLPSIARNLGGPWPCAAHQPRAGPPHLTGSSQAFPPHALPPSLGAAASLSSVPAALTRWAWGHRQAHLPSRGQKRWLPSGCPATLLSTPSYCVTAQVHVQPDSTGPHPTP